MLKQPIPKYNRVFHYNPISIWFKAHHSPCKIGQDCGPLSYLATVSSKLSPHLSLTVGHQHTKLKRAVTPCLQHQLTQLTFQPQNSTISGINTGRQLPQTHRPTQTGLQIQRPPQHQDILQHATLPKTSPCQVYQRVSCDRYERMYRSMKT